MRTVSNAITFCVACLFCGIALAAAAPPPETLTLRDLAGRPERWPEAITIKRDLRFGDGAGLKAGQSVTVLECNGSTAGVDAGNNQLFEVEVVDTDLLDAANAAWSKLNPAQRALDVPAVQADPSLWPDKVRTADGFRLNSGKDVPPNTEFELMSIEGNVVTLWLTSDNAKLTSGITKTDIVKRARERAAIEPDKRPSRIAAALGKDLVDADGKPWAKQDLEKTRVFALYYGASWCGPCRTFSPGLVKYVNEVAAKHPELTVVLISNDEKDADMLKYMQEEKMPWPAAPLAKLKSSGVLQVHNKGAIPQLAIIDRHGKLIADCYRGAQRVGPEQPLAALKKYLENPTAAAK